MLVINAISKILFIGIICLLVSQFQHLKKYREAMGCCSTYTPVMSRPDIALAVSKASQFMENSGPGHWKAVKLIFRPLKVTCDMKFNYNEKLENIRKLVCLYYTEFTEYLDSRKSIISFLIIRVTNHFDVKETTYNCSKPTKGEYIALADTVKKISIDEKITFRR